MEETFFNYINGQYNSGKFSGLDLTDFKMPPDDFYDDIVFDPSKQKVIYLDWSICSALTCSVALLQHTDDSGLWTVLYNISSVAAGGDKIDSGFTYFANMFEAFDFMKNFSFHDGIGFDEFMLYVRNSLCCTEWHNRVIGRDGDLHELIDEDKNRGLERINLYKLFISEHEELKEHICSRVQLLIDNNVAVWDANNFYFDDKV